jgi:oxygen-independent coproporphyrinogen-3 oxidase
MLNAGIYIHIPFCIKKCAYCDFYSITDAGQQTPFLTALIKEIRLRSRPKEICDTLYFGGGTPSLFKVDALELILKTIRRNFSITKDAEITIEVNPATITLNRLSALHQMGINRINIGVQSFSDKQLNFLGRCHNGKDARRSIEMARRAGFKRMGIDLIYALPDQSEKLWQKDLNTALEYLPEHISCYMLTYEAGTPMDKKRQSGDIIPLDDDKAAGLFEFTAEFLKNKGYDHYEISNFAHKDPQVDFRSRHNRKYWNFAPYFGFGPAAHSFKPPVRKWNLRHVAAYIKSMSQNRLPIAETEKLSSSQQRMEALYLGLRQLKGIDVAVFEKKFQAKPLLSDLSLLQKLQKEKMVVYDGVTFALTVRGMRYIDSIVPLL